MGVSTRRGRITAGTVFVSVPLVVPAWLRSIVTATGADWATWVGEFCECVRQ